MFALFNTGPRAYSAAATDAAIVTAVTGLYEHKGSTDCSGNPNYPVGAIGDVYLVSVAGKIGGASGKTVEVGDKYVCDVANAGGTEAAVGSSWTVIQGNVAFSANGISFVTAANYAAMRALYDDDFIVVAASDETTALTAGTAKVKFRIPYAFTVTAVYASLSTTQTSGSIFTVDVNEGGTTIISTKLTIDNGETTSTTAAAPPVISDAALAADAEMSVDIDQIGDGTAKGLKVIIRGYRT